MDNEVNLDIHNDWLSLNNNDDNNSSNCNSMSKVKKCYHCYCELISFLIYRMLRYYSF